MKFTSVKLCLKPNLFKPSKICVVCEKINWSQKTSPQVGFDLANSRAKWIASPMLYTVLKHSNTELWELYEGEILLPPLRLFGVIQCNNNSIAGLIIHTYIHTYTHTHTCTWIDTQVNTQKCIKPQFVALYERK